MFFSHIKLFVFEENLLQDYSGCASYVDYILYCGTVIHVREFESSISTRFKLKSTTSTSSYYGVHLRHGHD